MLIPLASGVRQSDPRETHTQISPHLLLHTLFELLSFENYKFKGARRRQRRRFLVFVLMKFASAVCLNILSAALIGGCHFH